MDEPHARIIEDDGIITVMIDRPEKRNAISHDVTAALWDAVTRLEDRDDLRCMVIASEGPYFTAGLDLSSLGGSRPGNPETQHLHPGWNFRRNYRSHHLLYDEIETVEKPVVLAVQGICLGAGVEMGVSCDFRFCTPNAAFELPEVRLGGVAGSGGSSRLARLVGPAWAKWMAMAGMRIDAQRALMIGLVQDIYEEDGFLEQVYAFCRRIMEIDPEVLGLAKLAIDIHTDVQDRTVQRHVDRLVVGHTFDRLFAKNMERFGLGKPQRDE